MSSTAFGLSLFLERAVFSEAWLGAWLKKLWQQGLSFSAPPTEALTWEAALPQVCACYLEEQRAEVSLAEAIRRLAEQGAGSIQVWDRSIDLLLTIEDDPFIGATPAYKRIRLPFDASLFHRSGKEPLPARQPLYPFQQAQIAFLHWSEVFCRETQPLFGLGAEPEWVYRQGETITQYTRGAEAALARALQHGQFPELPPWVSWLYLGAPFVPAPLLEAALHRTDTWMKRAPDGSLFLFCNPPESQQGFHYLAGEIFRLLDSGRAALNFSGPDWERQAWRVMDIYDRAKALAQASGFEGGVKTSERYMVDLMELITRIKAAKQGQVGPDAPAQAEPS